MKNVKNWLHPINHENIQNDSVNKMIALTGAWIALFLKKRHWVQILGDAKMFSLKNYLKNFKNSVMFHNTVIL